MPFLRARRREFRCGISWAPKFAAISRDIISRAARRARNVISRTVAACVGDRINGRDVFAMRVSPLIHHARFHGDPWKETCICVLRNVASTSSNLSRHVIPPSIQSVFSSTLDPRLGNRVFSSDKIQCCQIFFVFVESIRIRT